MSQPSRIAGIAEAMSFAVPWTLGLLHASPVPRFADDIALVRSLGLLPVGLEGLISSALASVFSALPVGSQAQRVAFAAALGLGTTSWLLYRLILTWLAVARTHPPGSGSRLGLGLLGPSRLPAACGPPVNRDDRLDAALAVSAALTTALGPSFVLQGSGPGGFGVAAALALSALCIALGVFALGPRAPLLLGVLVAATFLESRWTGLALVLSLAVRVALCRPLQRPETLRLFAAGLVGVVLLPVALAVALKLSPSPSAQLAFGLLDAQHGRVVAVDRSVALSAWLAEVGLVWCALGLLGLWFGVLHRSVRPLLLPLCAFLALDLSVGLEHLNPTRPDPHGAVRLIAMATLAAAAALAVRITILALRNAKIPFAPTAATLLVVYNFSLVFVSLEDSARSVEARDLSATEVWTDEALGSLPPSSALLLRSEALHFRLLSARYTQGRRPDLLLVPLPLLERSPGHARALAREAGLLPLVREVLLAGRPGEYALSALADVRPLYIEPDRRWEQRLYSHLTPQPFFTSFAAHPLGRSDRRLGLTSVQPGFTRALDAVQQSPNRDPATRAVLAADLSQRALIFCALGDRDLASDVVSELLLLEPRAEIGLRLRERLSQPGRGRLDVTELLAVR